MVMAMLQLSCMGMRCKCVLQLSCISCRKKEMVGRGEGKYVAAAGHIEATVKVKHSKTSQTSIVLPSPIGSAHAPEPLYFIVAYQSRGSSSAPQVN